MRFRYIKRPILWDNLRLNPEVEVVNRYSLWAQDRIPPLIYLHEDLVELGRQSYYGSVLQGILCSATFGQLEIEYSRFDLFPLSWWSERWVDTFSHILSLTITALAKSNMSCPSRVRVFADVGESMWVYENGFGVIL